MFRKFLLPFFLLTAACINQSHAQERVALVIGNGAYAHANALPNPANDADDMAAALRDLNFHVIVATNLDKNGFDQKLRDFAKVIRGARTALFYYAGHGLQVAGKNYAIPVDAKLEVASDLTFEAIDLDFVVSLMQADGDRVNLVFLDACRDNPLARSFARALPATRSGAVASGLSSVEAGRGTLIAFATAPNKVALDGRGRNSPFTGALVKHIGTPNLDIAFVMRRVTADVEAASNGSQIPWVHASLTKDVVLKAGAGTAAPAPYAPPVVASLDPGTQPPAAAKVGAPNEPLPNNVTIDRSILQLVETHPFFADAPPVSVSSYSIGVLSNSRTLGIGGNMTMDSNDVMNARWLRAGIVKLDETKRYSVNNSGATGNYSIQTTAIGAANGLLYLGSSINSVAMGKRFTTTSRLTRIDNLQGKIFPVRVGNTFSYDTYSEWRSSVKNGSGSNETQSKCEVTKRYDARVFHSDLTGSAFVLACDSKSTDTSSNTVTDLRNYDVFFESLGVWLKVDPVSPRERIVMNNQTTTSGKYTTVMNGTYTLRSFVRSR